MKVHISLGIESFQHIGTLHVVRKQKMTLFQFVFNKTCVVPLFLFLIIMDNFFFLTAKLLQQGIQLSYCCAVVCRSVMSNSLQPHGCSCQAPLSMTIFQARILKWVAMPSSRGSSQPRDGIQVDSLPSEPLGKPQLCYVKESEVAQSCPILCDPMDCSLSGSSVHGIFQARVLEWIAVSFSGGSSRPRNQTRVSHIAGRRFTV